MTSSTSHTTHKTMPQTELTLDQLQTISGGATAIEYGLIATLLPKDQVSVECKVPPRFSKPVARLIGSADPGGDDI